MAAWIAPVSPSRQPLGSGEMPHSGQHDALGGFDDCKITVGNHGLSAKVPQRLEHRGEVARFVVDYGYAH